MKGFGIDGLSQAEIELLSNYLIETEAPFTSTVAGVLTSRDFGGGNFGAGVADILPYISDEVSEIDRHVFRFDNMRRNLNEIVTTEPPSVDLPEGAIITPEKLHRLAIRTEMHAFYTQAGLLLEEFSKELILERMIDENRRSNRVESDINYKSQSQREWWLWVAGIIDENEKDDLRRAYDARSDFVHELINEEDIETPEQLLSNISETWETVNILHEKLYGLEMEFRISELVIGNEF